MHLNVFFKRLFELVSVYGEYTNFNFSDLVNINV